MPRSIDTLFEAFAKDEIDLTPAVIVDYGFVYLNDDEYALWFALLRDWKDFLENKYGETKAKDLMHKAAVTGSVVEEMEKLAQQVGDRWTRWPSADETKLQGILAKARDSPY